MIKNYLKILTPLVLAALMTMPAGAEVQVDQQALLEAVDSVLEDPALRTLTAISAERFKNHMPKAADSARVTRGWLDSLEQRHFFLALGYQATACGSCSATTSPAWASCAPG